MQVFSAKKISGAVVLLDPQSAVYAADGYSRSTGMPSIVLTSGIPEALKAAAGMLTPWGDKLPVIICNTECDAVEFLKNSYAAVTRTSFVLNEDKEVKDIAKKISERLPLFSPVQVIIAKDVNSERLIDEIKKNAGTRHVLPLKNGAQNFDPLQKSYNQKIQEIIETLKNSRKPVILLGSGAVKNPDIIDQISKLAGYLDSVLLLTASATCMPVKLLKKWCDAHENKKLVLIPAGNPVWMRIFSASDVVIALGTALSEVDWFGLKVKISRAKIIRVSSQSAEREISDLFIKMEVAEFVKSLLEDSALLTNSRKKNARTRWRKASVRWMELIKAEAEECRKFDHIEPCLAAYEIVEGAPESTIFISEGGACGMWLWSYLWLRPFVFPVQNGTIGVSIPVSIGVKTGNPENPVWCVLGDGAFFYNLKELKKLRESGSAVAIFVFNDSSWGAIRLAQTFVYKNNYTETDLPETEYAEIARSFGCEGLTVRTPQELKPAIEQVKNSKVPVVVDIKVNKDSIPYVGASFVTAEFDGTLAHIIPDLIISSIISIANRRVPRYVTRPLSRLINL